MKGGKRLSEEERQYIYNALDISDPWKEVMIAKAMLKRDDEPEYCTCGPSRVAKCFEGVIQCDNCGKPVKGE